MSTPRKHFAKLYEKHADEIFRYLYVRTSDRELAEDLASETFSKALESIDSFDFGNGRAWLYAIARNKLIDHWRAKKTLNIEEAVEIIDESATLAEKTSLGLEIEKVRNLLKSLTKTDQEIIQLRFFQGMSAKETADVLDMSEENVRVKQFRALKKLKEKLS
jgi:RNA polymerase sigma-70 factor (ECF subfamily)